MVASAQDFTKRAVRIVELELDRCSRTFGSAPCTATGNPCYLTRTTCRSVDAFDVTPWTIRLIDAEGPRPTNIDAIPCVLDLSEPATQIDERSGLAPVGEVRVTVADCASTAGDGLDPFFRRRAQTGDFWKRLKAITAHIEARSLRIYEGYLEADGTVDLDACTERQYLLSDLSGPDDTDRVVLSAKDPFERLKADIPAATTGELDGDITDSATSLTLTGDNLDEEYHTLAGLDPSGGDPIWIKIDDEILLVEGRSGATLSSLTRGACNTTAAAHSSGAGVQQVVVLDGNVVDVWQTILEAGDIDTSLIDTTGAAAAKASGLSAFDVYRVVTEPQGADRLLQSLLETCLSFSWWDAEAQLVKIRQLRPPAPGELVRLARSTLLLIDTDAESSIEYRQPREKTVFAPWFGAAAGNLVLRIASTFVSRYRNAPTAMTLALEDALARDAAPGAIVAVTTRAVQGADGTSSAVLGWVRGKRRWKGSQIVHQFEWVSAGFAARYWYYAPESLRGLSYDAATLAQRLYAFLADADGLLPDGTTGYVVQ